MWQQLITWLKHLSFLVKKEFLTIFSDPANRAILFVPALMQALLFGYAATYDVNHVDYAILDQSSGQISHELISKLDGSGIFKRVATLEYTEQIKQVIDNRQALLAITIPNDFESKLNNNQSAPIQVIVDGRNSSTAMVAGSYLNKIIGQFNQQKFNSALPISLETRTWYNPNQESRWSLMPALIAALSMMQTLLLSALSVAREREQGTFDQLLVTPYTPLQIMIGKALPPIFVGLMQSTIILLIILFWFKIPMNGSIGLLYFGLLSFLSFNVAVVGVGLSISALSLNMQQAMLFTFLLIMPLMLLSGLLTPVENMPKALQVATYANPLRFGINLVQRVYLEGASFAQVKLNFLPMIVLGIVTLPLAAWLFRN
ncbi:antibiotic ABC transporter permease, partial [Acinetobacter baumannii]